MRAGLVVRLAGMGAAVTADPAVTAVGIAVRGVVGLWGVDAKPLTPTTHPTSSNC